MHSQNVEARKGGTISRSYLADSIFAFRAVATSVTYLSTVYTYLRLERRPTKQTCFFQNPTKLNRKISEYVLILLNNNSVDLPKNCWWSSFFMFNKSHRYVKIFYGQISELRHYNYNISIYLFQCSEVLLSENVLEHLLYDSSLLHNTKHIGGADEYLERLIFCQ